jgi:hypothetical protein
MEAGDLALHIRRAERLVAGGWGCLRRRQPHQSRVVEPPAVGPPRAHRVMRLCPAQARTTTCETQEQVATFAHGSQDRH